MAGEWIKFEAVTLDKPEVLQLADLLEIEPDEVVGKLLRVWVWFDKNSIDGNAGGVTDVTLMKFLDRLVSRQGFAACMKKVGWLTDFGLPNFDRHNGKTAKKRAVTSRRVENFRNAHVTPEALPEKRREEKKKHIPANKKTAIPKDFAVSESVADWAKEKGFDKLDQHLESFIAKCNANGYKYADWDAAFREAVRGDWAGIRKNAPPKQNLSPGIRI